MLIRKLIKLINRISYCRIAPQCMWCCSLPDRSSWRRRRRQGTDRGEFRMKQRRVTCLWEELKKKSGRWLTFKSPPRPLLFSSLLILIPKIRLVGCFVIFIFGCKTYQDYQITLQTLLLLLPKQCTSIPLFPSLSSFKITNCGFVIFSFCLFRWMVDDWMLH